MKTYIKPTVQAVIETAEDILTLSVASGNNPNNMDFESNFLKKL